MAIYNTLKIYDLRKCSHLYFDRNKYLQDQIRGKTVLHVGCSDYPITKQRLLAGSLLHSIINAAAKDVIGIDISDEGINILKEYGFMNVKKMDAEYIKISKTFDVILATDVVEHLNNPGLFLSKIESILDTGGELIIGVPSALTFNNIKAWFLGWEQVHKDHTFYFSPKTIANLCARYSLLPTKLVFTVQPATLNESLIFLSMRKIILKLFRSMAPSIIMHFKRVSEVDKGIYFEWK